jgi:hypothetical protein
MQLLMDWMEPIEDVTAEQLGEVLEAAAFGGILVLMSGDDEFIQFGEGELEYRDAATGRMFRLEDWTWEQVRLAFLDYLAGGIDWRNFDWRELDLIQADTE